MAKLIKPKRDFTMIGNHILRDPRIPLKAIGLYCKIAHYPDNWSFSSAGLADQCCESRNTINNILRCLEEFGYLERISCRGSDGRIIDWDYKLYIEPHPKKRDMVFLDMDFPDVENEAQINTVNNNKKIIKTESLIKKQYCELKRTDDGFIDESCRNCYRINSCAFPVNIGYISLFGDDFYGVLYAMVQYFFSNKNYDFNRRKEAGILTELENEFDILLDAEPELLDPNYRAEVMKERLKTDAGD